MSCLETEREGWIAAATDLVDVELLRELVIGMVDIPSPTGEEAGLAQWLTDHLTGAGLEAHRQDLDANQANAVARLRGSGGGEDLLLYAPIDTLTVGDPAEDVPWIGPTLRPDMQPRAIVNGDYVIGLGASNPKGHAAAVVAAAEVISRAGVPLEGDLLVGLGAGGMPTNGRVDAGLSRHNTGQGVGASFMLEQGWWADHALIAKPGWAVAWEEVGLCWFEVRVHGTYTYVGSRHRMPYANAVRGAAEVVRALEDWFPQYTERHTGGLVEPQGVVSSIEGGWRRMAAVTPELCRLRVDLRTSPRATPVEVRREFSEVMARIAADRPELEIEWDMVLAIPGTATDQEALIVRTAVDAWEAVAGRSHAPITGTSGATDANILRARGLPTARIGMDRIDDRAPLDLDFPSGMNVVDLREAVMLTRAIIRTAIATCAPARESMSGSAA